MQPPLHREHRQAKLLTHAAERDVEDAIKAEYERDGLPMEWREMERHILALEKQVASLEDRFTALLDQGTAHEKELSEHVQNFELMQQTEAAMTDRLDVHLEQLTELHAQTEQRRDSISSLEYDRASDFKELQALKELVQKQASEIASLDRAVRNLSDQHI